MDEISKTRQELINNIADLECELAELRNIKTQHQQLKAEHQLQTQILSHMGEGIHLVRVRDGIIMYTNHRFDDIFGYEHGEIIGKHISIVNAPTDQTPEETANQIMNALNTNDYWYGEIENIKKDGTHIWTHASISTFEHPEFGEVWLSVQTDITNQKQTQKALAESEGQFRTLFDAVADRIMMLDRDGTILMMNRLSPDHPEQYVGANLFDTLLSTVRQDVKSKVEQVFLTGQPVNFVIQSGQNPDYPIWCEGRLAPVIQNGLVVSVTMISADITGRKLVEETLRKQATTIEQVQEIAKLGFWEWDLESGNIKLSKHACTILGFNCVGDFFQITLDDVIQVIHPDDRPILLRQIEQAQDQLDESFPSHIRLAPPNDERYIYLKGRGLINELTGKRYRLGYIQDITDHKLLEKQQLELLFERERSRILEDFIQQATHEFRTPLTIIGTGLHILSKSTTEDMKQRQIEKIENSLGDIITLIDGLTMLSNLEHAHKLELTHVNIHMLLQEIMDQYKSLAEDQQIQLVDKLDQAQKMFVYGDFMYLDKAITAILDNAIRFTPVDGVISVDLDIQKSDIIIRIKDNGIGIPPDELNNIFKRFYRVSKVGTLRGLGLGLAIAKQIITLHNGDINVESHVGQGSTFYIRLPLISVQTP